MVDGVVPREIPESFRETRSLLKGLTSDSEVSPWKMEKEGEACIREDARSSEVCRYVLKLGIKMSDDGICYYIVGKAESRLLI